MLSAVPSKADFTRLLRHVSFVPVVEVAEVSPQDASAKIAVPPEHAVVSENRILVLEQAMLTHCLDSALLLRHASAR